jgi:hypothetical protein
MKTILTYFRNIGRALMGKAPVQTQGGGPGPWKPPK